MMYWNGHMTTAGWIIAVLWTVIIFALIASAIYWLVAALANRGPAAGGGPPAEASAREILDRRLAKGELSIEQYTQLRDTLAGETPPADGGQPSPSSHAGTARTERAAGHGQ